MLIENKITYPVPRLSASRIKNLSECSFSFYCQNYLKIPSDTHPKTLLGSCAHMIFEVLQNPRHRKHHDKIVKTKDIYSSKSITRLIKLFLYKNPIPDNILKDLNTLVLIGLKHDFFCEGSEKLLPPEYEFNIPIKNNICKGLIDKLAIYKDHAVCTDYKTQKVAFSQDELKNNIQAMVYSWAIWKIFSLPCSVNFLQLRHDRIQSVPAFSIKELEGIEKYLNYLADEFEKFDEKSATTNYKAETAISFCNYVCPYKQPKEYYAAFENGQLKETSMIKDKLSKYPDVRLMSYKGCSYFYNSQGQKRNFN
jgi:hypothetical protein